MELPGCILYNWYYLLYIFLTALCFLHSDVDMEAQFSLNQSRAEEITMREDYGHNPNLDQEDGFELNFEEEGSELIRNNPYDQVW